MKKNLVLLFLFCNLSLFAQNEGIKFEESHDLQAALTKAEKEGKLVFVDCYTTWCGPCKMLSANIFPLKEVGDFYNKHFINVKIDMEDKPNGVEVRKKYEIRGFPTLLFLNPKGEIEHIQLGAGDAENVIELGKTALDKTANFKALVTKIKEGDKRGEVILNYLNTSQNIIDRDSLINSYFSSINEADKYSEVSWNIFNRHLNDIKNDQFKFFLKNRKNYEEKIGKSKVEDKLLSIFNEQSYQASKEKLEQLKKIDPVLFERSILITNFYVAFNKCRQDRKNKESWDEFIKQAKSLFSTGYSDAGLLNTVCWYIYENYKTFNDNETLKLAKEWSKRSLEEKPEVSYINDTYAHILFDLGEVEEAIKYQELAVKYAKIENSGGLDFYQKEVERYKKALK